MKPRFILGMRLLGKLIESYKPKVKGFKSPVGLLSATIPFIFIIRSLSCILSYVIP